jgi:hypothetical protein
MNLNVKLFWGSSLTHLFTAALAIVALGTAFSIFYFE